MKLIRIPVLFLSAIILLTACNKITYRKTAGGMPYQVFKGDDKQKIMPGDIVKYQVSYKIKDSVWFSSFGLPASYTRTGNPLPYDVSELWTSLAVGDSLVTIQMLDTFIKRAPNDVPREFRKGVRLITCFKVLGVLQGDSAVMEDQKIEQKGQLDKEIAYLEKFLASKNIKTQKTKSGALVQILEPGTGNLIDSGNFVAIKYTGVTMAGKKFDSNIDPAFMHTEPLTFSVGDGRVVKGFDEPMLFLRKGASAKVYVPSMIAYGARPDPNSGILPYENLVFDLMVVDVKDKVPTEIAPLAKTRPKVDSAQRRN